MKSRFGTDLTVITVSIPTQGGAGLTLADQVKRLEADLKVRYPERYGMNVLGTLTSITAYVSLPTSKIGA